MARGERAHLPERVARQLRDTGGGHAEQEARRRGLTAREMPGEGEHGLGDP